MWITVRGRHVGVSEKLRRHARNQAESSAGARFSNAIVSPVRFERDKRLLKGDTLSVGDAVMRMDLGEPPAVMFRKSGHCGMNAVFRRRNSGIGRIDPKQTNQVA